MRRVLASALIAGVAVAAPVAALGAGSDNPYTPPVDTASFDGLAVDHQRLQNEARDRARAAERRAERRRSTPGPVDVPPHLQAIATCESGGNPRAIGGGGAFRGKYQFTVATWHAMGGQGDPAAAPEAEQDRRAAMLYAQAGPGQWPVCGR